MNTQDYSTKVTKTQSPVWMVDFTGELVDEVRTEERSSDGKWLKKHVSLTKKVIRHSASDTALAEKYGCDAGDLFG